MTIEKANTFRALAQPVEDTLGIIRNNLGNDTLTARDLDRITQPAGGALNWAVPSIDGEDAMKSIDGIILHVSTPRAYWVAEMADGDGNATPDCSSDDGVTGRMNLDSDPALNLGGDCGSCPMNQFGSDHRGVGKACKEKRLLYVLRQGDILPVVVQGASSSIQPLKKYLLRLANMPPSGMRYQHVVTKIGLEKAQSQGGITYSRPTFASGGALNEKDAKRIDAYVLAVRPLIEAAPVVPDVEESA
jgi:hypothetical protein